MHDDDNLAVTQQAWRPAELNLGKANRLVGISLSLPEQIRPK